MATGSEAIGVALGYRQVGRLGEAERVCREILAVDAEHVSALCLLGEIALQLGDFVSAAEWLQRAVQLQPDLADAHCNLGTAMQELGRLDEAAQFFRRTIELAPHFAEAHFNLGNLLRIRGQTNDAAACYRWAIELKPGLAMAHANLGLALGEQGELEAAAQSYRKAVELQPGLAEAHNGLGTIFQRQGKLDEAIACYSRAGELKPGFAEAMNNLGSALSGQERLDEAITRFGQALAWNPDLAGAHNNLGNAYKDQGRLDEAQESYRKAIAVAPGNASAHSNSLYTLWFHPGYDAATIHAEHRRWNEQHAAPLFKGIQPQAANRDPSRRLRVGYVSPDFRNHCQSFFTIPLFSEHDHRECEVFCYSDVDCPDEVTRRVRSYADQWREIKGLNDQHVAEFIRQDGIDILVDLTMHMSGGRPLLFARKPAPVQVCWLAYPGTTGLGTMDYRLTDPHLDPPGIFDRYCSEESVRLPETFWCYDPITTEPGVSALPALANGFVTFGSLNNFSKVNPRVLELWAGVLRAVERSRLVLLAPRGSCRDRTLDSLAQQGIAPERITLVGLRPRGAYLELYHQIDIGLDTFPYNGHTTSLDAFWMGVPVVSVTAQTVVGRAGISLNSNLGLPELITESPEQYLRIALELAGNWTRLKSLREGLRERMRASPLMDARRFARNVEAAYRSMWQRYCDAAST